MFPPTEEIIPLSEARRLDNDLTPALLARWGHQGIKGRAGRRVFLEVFRRGGTPVTTREAYNRFCDACTDESRYAIE